MSLRIDNASMSLEVDGRVIATAWLAPHAAADGQGAWIVSDRSARLLRRNSRQPRGLRRRCAIPPMSFAWPVTAHPALASEGQVGAWLAARLGAWLAGRLERGRAAGRGQPSHATG